MSKLKKVIGFLLALLIRFFILFAASVVIWGFVYRFEFKVDIISNSIFIVNVIVFLIALIIHLGATRIFISLGYTTKYIFNYKKTKNKYDGYLDYYQEVAPTHKKDMTYWLLSSALWLLIAIILASVYLQTKK